MIRNMIKKLLLILFVLVLLAAIWAFGIEPGLLTVTRLTIVDENLPANWDGRVVAFFSDTHLGATFDASRLARAADEIETAKPDLILFGGDLIDHRTPSDVGFVDSISQCLARMKAPLGQFAIHGNHDTRLNAELELYNRMLKAGGFQVLVNQAVELDGLLLGGLDESYFGQPDLVATFADQTGSEELFRILLMHQPDFAADLSADSADLMLAGHSHNGQFAIFNQPLLTVYQAKRYTYGYYQLADGRQMVVSRGLGTINVPARFGAAPEIMLITLRQN